MEEDEGKLTGLLKILGSNSSFSTRGAQRKDSISAHPVSCGCDKDIIRIALTANISCTSSYLLLSDFTQGRLS